MAAVVKRLRARFMGRAQEYPAHKHAAAAVAGIRWMHNRDKSLVWPPRHYSEDRLGNVMKDIPRKSHPWSDLGDSFCYLLCGLMPEMAEQLRPAKKATVITAYNPFR